MTDTDKDETLWPYVPAVVIDWLLDSPEASYRTVQGTLSFIDISGFTQLTERLAQAGKVGAEEIEPDPGTRSSPACSMSRGATAPI